VGIVSEQLDALRVRAGLDQVPDVAAAGVHGERLRADVLLAYERAQVLEDLPFAPGLVVEFRAEVAPRLERDTVALPEVARVPRGGRDRVQRLVDLVGEPGGHLAHQIEAADVAEACLERAGPLLGGSLAREVADDADEALAGRAVRLTDRERDGKQRAAGA